MRVRCTQGHWFDDDTAKTCDHLVAGDVCGCSQEDDADGVARLREALDRLDELGEPVEPDTVPEKLAGPHAADEARAALAAARERVARG